MNDVPEFLPRALFQNCVRVDPNSAERANESLQRFVVMGRAWYVDATLLCGRCGFEFLFAVSEQRFWYEELKFYVDSFPRLCPACRHHQKIRTSYDANIAAALASSDLEIKRQVIDLINQLDDQIDPLPDAICINRKRLEKQIQSIMAVPKPGSGNE